MSDDSLPWGLTQCRAGCWRAADLPGGLCYAHSGYPSRPSARIATAGSVDSLMPRPAPEPPSPALEPLPVPTDRPTLALCTRCRVRLTFYGTCCVCAASAVYRRAATPFQTARPRDSLFFAEEGE